MAVRQDKVQIDVEINGKGAGQTLEQLEKESKQLVRELRKMDPATEAFAKKAEKLKGIRDQTGNIKKEMFGVQEATKGTREAFETMNPYQQKFAEFGQILGGVKGKVLTVVQSMKTLRGAMIATGIGALVVVLGSLINYLTSTQAGMDKVTAVTRPLMAIFERMKGVVQELGGSVFKGLAMILKGDLDDGLKVLAQGAKAAVEGVRESVTEGWELGKQMDALQKQIEKDEIEMIKRRSLLQQIAKEQNFIVEDETKSYEQRRVAAEAALKAQEELQQIQLDLLDKKIAKMNLEHSQNDTSREDSKELAELEAQRADIIASVTEMRTTTRNKLNILNKAEAADHQKMIDEKQRAEQEYAKKVAAAEEALTDLRIATMGDETERRIAEINRRFEKEIAAFEGAENQKTEFLKLKEQERATELRNIREEEKRKDFEAALALEDEEAEFEKLRIEEKLINAIITDQEASEARLDIERQAMEDKLALIAQQHGMQSIEYQRQKNEILKFDQERTQKQKEYEEGLAEGKMELARMAVNQFADTVNATIDLLAKDEASRKKYAGVLKAMEIAKIKMNAIAEIQAIWKNAQSSPVAKAFGPIAGGILAAAQIGFVMARATAATNNVANTKFALGGLVKGSSHAQGGIAMIDRRSGQELGEMEGDEIILTKGVARDPMLRAAASKLNYLGGGRMFEAGGPVNPYRDNVPASVSNPQQAAQLATPLNQGFDPNMITLIQEVKSMNQNLSRLQTNLKAYVVYSDLESAADDVQQVRDDATLK